MGIMKTLAMANKECMLKMKIKKIEDDVDDGCSHCRRIERWGQRSFEHLRRRGEDHRSCKMEE